jgi:hypothetical protein
MVNDKDVIIHGLGWGVRSSCARFPAGSAMRRGWTFASRVDAIAF